MSRTPDPLANLRKPTMGTTPPGAQIQHVQHHILTSDDEQYNLLIAESVKANAFLKRLLAHSYNHSRPVDEDAVIPVGTTDPNQGIQISPDYTIAVRYTAIAMSLPLGTTSAVLQIGTTRQIPLYSGAAIATQTFQVIQGLGLVVDPNDKRMLFITGATSTGYINLIGHAFVDGDFAI